MSNTEISVTFEAHEHVYTATLSSDRLTVEIDRDGVWSGRGRWDGSSIQDCPALLVTLLDVGDEEEASYATSDVFDELARLLSEAGA